MKVPCSQFVLSAAILAILIPGISRAQEQFSHDVSRLNLEAKIEYCKLCHGQQGQGFSGSSPIPRLAGQTAAYLESKFVVIEEHKQDNPTAEAFMVPALGSVDPVIRKGIAKHFSSLDPAPAGDGPKELVAPGQKIYQEGVPGADVLACASCHGADAKGDGVAPRLAGQIDRYTIKVLANWTKVRGEAVTGPLAGKSATTHTLTPPQIEAVAAYLSHVK